MNCPLLTISLIPLTRGKYAIVDRDDYERLSQNKWLALKSGNTFYASRHPANKCVIWMHREILNTPIGFFTDHINRNGIDNRKSNLRICSKAENCHNQKYRKNNKSRFKGVCFHKASGKWQSQIMINYKTIHLGIFSNEVDAAREYDIKSKELHGQFAYTNF